MTGDFTKDGEINAAIFFKDLEGGEGPYVSGAITVRESHVSAIFKLSVGSVN